MAAILMPDINLRRRRRSIEEDRAGEHQSKPLLAPSSKPVSTLDTRSTVPHTQALARVSSLHRTSCRLYPVLSRMQRAIALVTARLGVTTVDDACISLDAMSQSQSGVEPSPSSASRLSVCNNQVNEGRALDDGLDKSSAPHSDSAAPTQAQTRLMGLQRGREPTVAVATVQVAAPTKTAQKNAHSPGPTLGDVMEAVSRNETDIDVLDFSFLLKRGKRLGAMDCVAIARALETNQTVRRLVLREHNIGDKGAAAIAAMLCRNSTLEYVDVCGNNITDDGVEALAQALYGHASLTHLMLWSNCITDRGATVLADAIKCNCSLRYLGLVQNFIAQVGAQALLDALDVNIHLETLNLATNEKVPAWLTAQIRAVLARNRLEAPRMRALWVSTDAPGNISACTQDNDAVSPQEDDSSDDAEHEPEGKATMSSSGSGVSGFLSCSGTIASAASEDGIWI